MFEWEWERKRESSNSCNYNDRHWDTDRHSLYNNKIKGEGERRESFMRESEHTRNKRTNLLGIWRGDNVSVVEWGCFCSCK